MKNIIIKETGSADVLKFVETNIPKPRKDQVLIRQTAIGVNFFDICFRRGQFPLSKLPAVLGMEGCGVIEATGEEVVDHKVGDRVAYATGGIGSYSEKRLIAQSNLIDIPRDIGDIETAGYLFKGMVAHALLHRVFLAKRAKKILIHSVAGGVGSILCVLAKNIGLEVIGTVGDDRKIAFAQALGCDLIVNYRTQNLVEEVKNFTKGGMVGAVYDGIGKDTIERSLQCLRSTGICINYGESSGEVTSLDHRYMMLNSLYLARPMVFHYKYNRAECFLTSREIFAALRKKIIRPQIKTYDFKDVARAHQALESRASIGSIVLKL
jgi:NADPH2:quinone reductase